MQLFVIQKMSYMEYISYTDICGVYIIMMKNCSAYYKWKIYFLNFTYFSLIPSNQIHKKKKKNTELKLQFILMLDNKDI